MGIGRPGSDRITGVGGPGRDNITGIGRPGRDIVVVWESLYGTVSRE